MSEKKVKTQEHAAPVTGETLPALPMPRSIRECSRGDSPDRWPTNLDTSTERGMALLLNAMNPPSLYMDESGQIRMRLAAYVYCIADAVDRETGEVDTVPKTVLIDTEGRTFVTRSAFAPDKMENLRSVYNEKRWKEGIPIVIREHRSPRTKQTSHVIELDLSAQ